MPLPQTAWEQMVEDAMQVCVDTFGEGTEGVQVTHSGGVAYPANGIFEANSTTVDPDTGLSIVSNQPQISFKLSALEQMPDLDDEILVRDVLYRVVDPQFDGQGTVTVRLQRL